MKYFDDYVNDGDIPGALRYFAEEYYRSGRIGHTRYLVLKMAAGTIEGTGAQSQGRGPQCGCCPVLLKAMEAEVDFYIDSMDCPPALTAADRTAIAARLARSDLLYGTIAACIEEEIEGL
jgi:hypothetical protein